MEPGIIIHGGAGADSAWIQDNEMGIRAGLQAAADAGNKILKASGTAIEAVERAVMLLENNYLFNAGRGGALNHKREVEMDASIMDGITKRAGAIAGVKRIKNPVTLARLTMEQTNHVLIAAYGAEQLARKFHLQFEEDDYFITEHQVKAYFDALEKNEDPLKEKIHGTVGAVAVDLNGNVASATSTGGLENALPGRIGDSCIIGAGCYADNNTCAVSGTGDGEYLITGVIAHSVSFYLETKKCSVQEACDYVIKDRSRSIKGDLGVIGINSRGEIGISFNSERMHRAWICGTNSGIEIY